MKFLIVDGVRHIEVLQLISLFIEVDSNIRDKRLLIRGEILSEAKHVAEGDLLALRNNSDIIIKNNMNGDVIILDVIKFIFDVRLQRESYGLLGYNPHSEIRA